MSLLPDQSSTTDPPTSTLLTSDLIAFNDHFVEFQGACAFLCDSIIALTTAQLELDKASVHGLHMYAGQVKQRAQVLKEQLQELRGKPYSENLQAISTKHL